MTLSRLTLNIHPRRIAVSCAMIAGAVVVFAGLFNTFSPKRIPWVDNYSEKPGSDARKAGLIALSLEETRAAVTPGSGFLVLDARSTSDYDHGHLPAALSTPARDLAQSMLTIQSACARGEKVLVYCSGVHCQDAITLGKALKQDGFTEVHVFLPGFEAWKEAGLEIQK